VEQLIWDYAKTLRSKGHAAQVINMPYHDEILALVEARNFEVVHLHYDVFRGILSNLHGGIVCVTSHFPYIDDQQRWEFLGYSLILSDF